MESETKIKPFKKGVYVKFLNGDVYLIKDIHFNEDTKIYEYRCHHLRKETKDYSTWIDHGNLEVVSKPKKGPYQKILNFLSKYKNGDVFILTNDYIIFDINGNERLYEKGTQIVLDEYKNFIEDLKKPNLDKYSFHIRSLTHVIGFIVDTTEKVYFPIELLKPFKWDRDVINKLVLENKEGILGFCSPEDNLIKYGIKTHKGKGKSILLRGAIGSGKSLTAEVISNYLKRPIIRLTNCGSVSSGFQLAQRYNLILLIDEADLFIMDRSQNPTLENILNFLRLLENYNIITIFTTNGKFPIDPAIESRMDLILDYSITPEIKTRIWQTHLPLYLKDKFNYDKYKESILNGRDIQKIVLMSARRSEKDGLDKIPIEYIYEEIKKREEVEEKNDANITRYFG